MRGYDPGEPVDVVIRPEHLTICEKESGMLKGTVKSQLFKGMQYETIVETRVGTSITVKMYVSEDKPVHNENAGEKIMFADTSIMVDNNGNWSPSPTRHGYSASIEAPGGDWIMNPTMHFRHNKRAVISYCDGHAATAPMLDSAYGDEQYQLGHPCANNDEMRRKYFDPRY